MARVVRVGQSSGSSRSELCDYGLLKPTKSQTVGGYIWSANTMDGSGDFGRHVGRRELFDFLILEQFFMFTFIHYELFCICFFFDLSYLLSQMRYLYS